MTIVCCAFLGHEISADSEMEVFGGNGFEINCGLNGVLRFSRPGSGGSVSEIVTLVTWRATPQIRHPEK